MPPILDLRKKNASMEAVVFWIFGMIFVNVEI